ncbi:MAG: D-alanine--D-alanine ligase [Candidatus Saccharibacteria bacterium]|nr:D-alanine--D-alanine ligase [Candidatus Saccharibacteria bacterium]
MQRTTVMLLFGGESSEHAVSISSARNVFAALDDTKYDVVLGYIDQSGQWWLLDNIMDQIDVIGLPQLLPVLGSGNFVTIPSSEVIKPNVILPILHGVNGEDGTIQGLAKLTHIPIVGSGVEASAVTMDKVTTKQLLEFNGIKTAPFEVHLSDEPYSSFHQLSEKLGSPLFVKPAREGSSVGVSMASNDEELSAAFATAHKYDGKVLIEKAIKGRELEIGVLGSGSDIRVSGVGEIVADREFYDYDSKYSAASETKVIIPADLPIKTRDKMRDIAKKAYLVLGCKGFARVDFFLSNDKDVYIIEANTLPGFTNISMYPKLWRQEGMTYSGIIDALISDALEK